MKRVKKQEEVITEEIVRAVLNYDCPACGEKREHTDSEWVYHPQAGCGRNMMGMRSVRKETE